MLQHLNLKSFYRVSIEFHFQVKVFYTIISKHNGICLKLVTLQVLTATLLVVTEVNFDLKLALYTSPKLPENELKSADGCFLRFIFGNIGAADEGAVVIFDCVCL